MSSNLCTHIYALFSLAFRGYGINITFDLSRQNSVRGEDLMADGVSETQKKGRSHSDSNSQKQGRLTLAL